jgi:hypothetical protein
VGSPNQRCYNRLIKLGRAIPAGSVMQVNSSCSAGSGSSGSNRYFGQCVGAYLVSPAAG